ncbi:autotransporter domain-containing protein [Sphingomonas sp.]|uniref:autotransporter domain-containing protein n=1 Tax=Sphingomonas sp. TaxID=28214 RepID=UPI001AFD0241|nr:autotransporter domain-containing protein [Sphingomonas sp.]MBO9714775.1 autotransporter domain-containing protein [Sphingomonas sp.]
MATPPFATRSRRRALRAALSATVALAGLATCPAAAMADPAADGASQSIAGSVEAQTIPGSGSTSGEIVDPNDVTGVGQLIVDFGFGSSSCTASLINPRTIIFAAHCVNEKIELVLDEATGQYVAVPTGIADPNSYGAGGISIGFGARADNMQGFRDFTNPYSPSYHRTDLGNFFYNISQVVYNPVSVELAQATGDLETNFFQGDIAMATLDTPAAGVPTWAMLFSALPTPGSISDTDGTGYHVTIGGYGLTGDGVYGAYQQIDYRRRIAENMIGMFGSFDDLDVTLGFDAEGLKQSLYFLDFDSPTRDAPNDYNLFKDDAQPIEGITAQGDSGGPLILDKLFADPVILGVLSGGSAGGPDFAPGSYGSISFYQPLFLYWDWIAANNAYHYVDAKAGNGAWEDPDHWVTVLDPSYRVIDADGKLVNGIPGTAGTGTGGTDHPYGQICQQSKAQDVDQCYDLATETLYDHGVVVPQTDETETGDQMLAELKARADAAGDPLVYVLPAATLSNGLPGASGFSPANQDPDPANGVHAAYFDVTLATAGTTTLSSNVTVDRFAIGNAAAKLEIKDAGSLTSLIDTTQFTGEMVVDGKLTSVGDFMLVSGLLRGHGTITAPYFTNTMGTIAPAGAGSLGTLTVNGNVVLASKSILAIDIGANGASDTLAVKANKAAGSDGIASLGGQVGLLPTAGTRVKYGDVYHIVTAEGGIDGAFSGVNSFSAILKSVFVYGANSVDVKIDAASYGTVIDPASPVQASYAALLDQNRSRYSALADLYGPLDMEAPDQIRATLDALTPAAETLKTEIGIAATETASNLVRDRLTAIAGGNSGGTLTLLGKPIQLAQANTSLNALGGSATAMDAVQDVRPAKLPDDMSAFLAAGYVDGSGARITGLAGKDSFTGFGLAAGVEKLIGTHATIGLAASYTDLKGDSFGGKAKGTHFAGTLYGRYGTGKLALDAQVALGSLSSDTSRTQQPVGPGQLKGSSNAMTVSGEIGLSGTIKKGAFSIEPRAALRGERIAFGDVEESGGAGALAIRRDAFKSVEGRASVTFAYDRGTVRPFATAAVVHRFDDSSATFVADFAGGTGTGAPFALTSWDKGWAEVSGGLRVHTGSVDLALSGQTSIGRDDIRTRTLTGSATFRF